MRHYELRTLGSVSLEGPAGPVPLDEPHLVALLVMLATAGDAGVRGDELLLRLYPNATPQHARAELARLLAVLRLRLGSEDAVRELDGVHSLRSDLVRMDARVLPDAQTDARADFLAGFSLPSSPEFREWLADVRRRVVPTAPAPRRAAMGRRLAGVLAAALLVVAVAAAVQAWRSRATDFGASDVLVLADLANETGDSLFDGLGRAVALSLEQSRHVRLYPRERLPDVFQRMQLRRDTALTFALAQEVAEREGVRFVLGIQIGGEGGAYRISAHLADVVRGRTRSTTVLAARQEEVIGSVGEMLGTVRRQLGESRGEVAERAAPLPQVTTSSLEALRSFAAGGSAWDRGDFRLARDLWERAVDLDSGFATALAWLGQYHFYHHERDRGREYYLAALSHADRLTERERLRLEGNWAADRGDGDSAAAVWRQVAERYPSASTWQNYGTILLRARRDAEVLPALRRALEFDSTSVYSATIWVNLATALGRLDLDAQAVDAYHRAAAADSTILFRGNLNHEYGMALVRLGRLDEAESAYTRMASGPTLASRFSGLRSLGFLAVWRGRIDEGARCFAQSAAVAAEDRKPLTESRNRLLLAWTHRLAGRRAAAAAELDTVLAHVGDRSFEPTFLSFVVIALVRQERLDEADEVLRVLRTRVAPTSAADVAAESVSAAAVALGRRRPADALGLIGAAGAYLQPVRGRVLEAEALAASGRPDAARSLLTAVAQREVFGSESQEDWMSAVVLLGDLRLAAGDTAGARRAWHQLAGRWSEAPPSLPAVRAVRARLAAIAGTAER